MILPLYGTLPAEPTRGDSLPEGPSNSGADKEELGVIYTCKYPGCTRQYASTDGTLSTLSPSSLSFDALTGQPDSLSPCTPRLRAKLMQAQPALSWPAHLLE